jgi:hypothetical protein
VNQQYVAYGLQLTKEQYDQLMSKK